MKHERQDKANAQAFENAVLKLRLSSRVCSGKIVGVRVNNTT